MGQALSSTLRWTSDDVPKLEYYNPFASHHGGTGPPTSSSGILRRSCLSGSRHPSPSLAYDFAHEGLWDKLLQRCREYPNDCMYMDKFYNTPLHLACRRQPPLPVLQALIQANSGALRIRTIDGLTPLHFACYCGAEYGIIHALVQAYPEAAGLCDKRGRTPLHFSTAGFRTADRARVINCLLDVQSDVVNWEDNRGRTPLTLLFEDYAEEIEGGEIQEVLSRMMLERRHRRKMLAPQDSRSGEDDGYDGAASIASHSGIDWDEVSECWESIVLLIKASYFHLYRDSILLSTLLGAYEDDNATFNSALSSNSAATGAGRASIVKPPDEDYASELKWNIVHATVGVPRCPAKFVQIVLNLHPECVSQKDVNGNLPLHIAAKRTEFRAGEAEGSFPAPLVPTETRQEVEKTLEKRNIMNGSGDKHGSLALYKTQSRGSIAFCVDVRDVMEEERYKQSTSIIIQELVRIYPDAVRENDADGKIPFLLAIEHGKPWESGVQELFKSYEEGFDEEMVQQSLLIGLTAELSSLSKKHSTVEEESDEHHKESNYIFKQIACNPVQMETTRTLSKLLPFWKNVATLAEKLISQCQLSTYSETINPMHDVATKSAMLESLAAVLRHMSPSCGTDSDCTRDIMKRGLVIGKKMLYGTQKCIRESAAKVLGAACNALGPETTTMVLRDVILLGPHPRRHVEDRVSTSAADEAVVDTAGVIAITNSTGIDEISAHGKAWGTYCVFSLPVGKLVDSKVKYFIDDKNEEAIYVVALVKDLVQHNSAMVREAACLAMGTLIGSSSEAKSCLKEAKSALVKVMRLAESTEVLTSLADGLSFAARESKGLFRSKNGIPILDGALMLAMSGPPNVKLAYNKFLWLALDVGEGYAGLHEYMKSSQGENGKVMMALVTKVLGQMKEE